MRFLPRRGRWAIGCGRRVSRFLFLFTAFFFSAGYSQNINLCSACHGPDGNSTSAGVPSIAGQPKLFIETQLVLFREGIRGSDQMRAAVRGLKDPEIVRLAEHFSRLRAQAAPGNVDIAIFNRGEALARKNRCGICHVADFRGQNQVPRLAGQREEYLLAEMRAYRDNKRRGGDTIMAAALYGVADGDIGALAHFLARSR